MLSIYPACFFKEKRGYSVVFPDLNYLATNGKDLDEAMEMAVDCLAGYLWWCDFDGEKPPAPSLRENIKAADIAKELELKTTDDGFVNLISVDVQTYAKEHFDKSIRKSITIPSWLNDTAEAMGINFSQTLKEGLVNKIRAAR